MVENAQLIWTEGLALSQHHLQYHDHLRQNCDAAIRRSLHPWGYGLSQLVIDHAALTLGWLSINRIHVLLPDQRWLQFESSDDHALCFDLRTHTEFPLKIAITLAASTQITGINGYPNSTALGAYRADYINIGDQYDTNRRWEIAVAKPSPLLIAVSDIPNQSQALPIVEIDKTHQSYTLSSRFIPSVLNVSASTVLTNWCGEMANLCQQVTFNCKALQHFLQHSSGLFWHYHFQAQTHPYSVFLTTLSLLSALAQQLEIPLAPKEYVYDHANLSDLFTEQKIRLETQLIQLQAAQPRIYSATLHVPGIWHILDLHFPTTEFDCILEVIGHVGSNWANQFVQETKIAAPSQIDQVIAAHSSGVSLFALSSLLSPIQCFQLDCKNNLWPQIQLEKAIAIYTPTSLPNDSVRLKIIDKARRKHVD